jgi:AbrB family looped-hinge helix DNA binding protein
MPLTSTINAKGQITIPQLIRVKLGIVAKSKVYFSLVNGTLTMRVDK